MLPISDANNTKFVLDRINQAEKYLGRICVQFGKVCRKEARVRDCNDEFVQNMFEFADRERINTTLRQSLEKSASYLSAITRIETQILEPLAKYGEIMKLKRQAVKKAISARDKGVQRQRKLQQTSHRDPSNRDIIVAIQVNAEYAQTESSRADNVVQDEIDNFEQMKLNHIKKYFIDFTLIHLSFHARAIEMYTTAHQQLLNIDIQHDLEEFRTAAPFHRLHSSQRSVSETVLNNPTRITGNNLSGDQSHSINALVTHLRDSEFDSHYSLPTDTNYYRANNQRSQSTRSASHISTLAREQNTNQGTIPINNKKKLIKRNVTESFSSSSDSDD